MTRALLVSLALLALAAAPAAAADLRRITVENEVMKDVPVVAPADEPKAIVALISDADGWTPAREAEAVALASEGALVIEIDMKRYLEVSNLPNEDCIFFSGDIEDYARLAGKTLDMKTYRLPALLGVGAGGDLAYAMLSQAPANMFSGAVSVGFTDRLSFPKPLCDGPKSTRREGADIVLGADPPEGLQGEWRILTPTPAPQATKDFIKDLDNADIVEQPDGADMAAAARDAAFDIGGGDQDAVNSLPLVLYEPKGPNPKGLAIIYAGDGGWRDLDKSIAGYFQQEGYGVIGVDTLRYFWNEKTPRELGDDLESIVTRYSTQWKTKRLLLAGYSFGADVIPFAWQHISRSVKNQVQLMALLGLSKTADFEVSVAGWLGVGSGDHDVLKPASTLPMNRVLCIYGKEELEDADNDVACATDAIPPSARLELAGGHHFDEDYESLAKRIDAEFVKRQGLVTGK
ncbi:MAG TPA: AcvB/VirJ family lysyl-phosphatidylglycerol hydrolase [Hansschlegelia sp.]